MVNSPKTAQIRHILSAIAVVIVALVIVWLTSREVDQWLGLPSAVVITLIAFGIQWLGFLHSWISQTERFYDLTGSLTYTFLAIMALSLSSTQDTRSRILAALVIIWALRLGPFLFIRISKSGGDDRFKEILPSPTRLFLVWTLQGLWISLTGLAAWVGITTTHTFPIGWIGYLGIALWLAGFSFEVTADLQKTRFKSDPANEGEFISTGLWSISRHPNYLGEIVLWTGVFVLAAENFSNWQYLAVLSPIFVTVLLTRVSGIPLLEKKADKRWGQRADYQEYKRNTAVLIPGFKSAEK
ncbi:MAG: DUF1295 domain-containing protein [Actinomycetaceae bacterium]|nr:DUF1295 domain-containing protein [Actinomycetaceae bacterium]